MELNVDISALKTNTLPLGDQIVDIRSWLFLNLPEQRR